jgi:hypothetical protein
MNIFIVIPTVRTLDFLKEWGDQFNKCSLLVVEDHPEVQIQPPGSYGGKVYHLTWADIQKDFGKDGWIFSRKNAGIRSYGFWKAYQLGADVIVTIDDDCYPIDDKFIQNHQDNLKQKAPEFWVGTYPHPDFNFTRGIPYTVRNKRQVVVSHGLWTNKIDLDGRTELNHPGLNLPIYPPLRQFIPRGSYYPMCSMNLAFARQVTPLMYFPLMGSDPAGRPWGYDRFDDIWAGIFSKKICDHLNLAVVNGSPFVEHRKASDPGINAIKEENGIRTNEVLWSAVDRVRLSGTSPASCYIELADKIKFPDEPYFVRLKTAMKIWGRLF